MWFFKRLILLFFVLQLWHPSATEAVEKFSRYRLCPEAVQESNYHHAAIENQGDNWFGRDKGLHFVSSMISTVAVGKTAQTFFGNSTQQSLKIGAGFAFALGLGKEVWDSTKKNNIFSYKDLTADILGILTGSILLNFE